MHEQTANIKKLKLTEKSLSKKNVTNAFNDTEGNSFCFVASLNQKKFYEMIMRNNKLNLLISNNNQELSNLNFIALKDDFQKDLNLVDFKNTKQIIEILAAKFGHYRDNNEIINHLIYDYRRIFNLSKKDENVIAQQKIKNFVQSLNNLHFNVQKNFNLDDADVHKADKVIALCNGNNLKLNVFDSYRISYTNRYSIENYLFDPIHMFVSLAILYNDNNNNHRFLQNKPLIHHNINDLLSEKCDKNLLEKDFQSIIEFMSNKLIEQLQFEIKEKTKIYYNLKYDKFLNKHEILNQENVIESKKVAETILPNIKVEYPYNFVLYMNGFDLVNLYHKMFCENYKECCFYNIMYNFNKDGIDHVCFFIDLHKYICKCDDCIFKDKNSGTTNEKCKYSSIKGKSDRMIIYK